jgi:hypothetical protein
MNNRADRETDTHTYATQTTLSVDRQIERQTDTQTHIHTHDNNAARTSGRLQHNVFFAPPAHLFERHLFRWARSSVSSGAGAGSAGGSGRCGACAFHSVGK